jgi:hypothetical protein
MQHGSCFRENNCGRVQLRNCRISCDTCAGRFFEGRITRAVKRIDKREHFLSGIALAKVGMACYREGEQRESRCQKVLEIHG